ncbi:MAG TPA: hypothetical protein VN721_11040 [Flavipsychrobacter sp.]|nr:hypothetical protein [Flavipsychrobacter sp.]
MTQIDLQSLTNTLKQGVIDLAKKTLKDYEDQAKADGQQTIDSMKDELETWGEELKSGQIDSDDLKDLIAGQEDLFKMTALEEAGVAAIEIDKFKSGLIELVTNTLLSII